MVLRPGPQPQQQQPQVPASQGSWRYRSKAALDKDDPTLRDGVDSEKLTVWRKQISQVIYTAGRALSVPQPWPWVAAMLCNRYFATRSMKRNDRFLIAQACLLLAAKMGEVKLNDKREFPNYVVRECLRVRWGKQGTDWDKQLMQAMQSGQWQREVEETRVAEFAVLYTLGFDLNSITHPYAYLEQAMADLGIYHPESRSVFPQYLKYTIVMQNSWTLLNDSVQTRLSLQYPPYTIAMGALFTANVIQTRTQGPEGDIMNVVRQKHPQAKNFLSHFRITKEEAQGISSQLFDMYEETKRDRDARKALAGVATAPISAPTTARTTAPTTAPTTPQAPTPHSPAAAPTANHPGI